MPCLPCLPHACCRISLPARWSCSGCCHPLGCGDGQPRHSALLSVVSQQQRA
ncbi:hypothetical protein BC831DRAFT_480436 [Entophlyctis helioformis]|nr:hypothetical protein BC831DRAFT_480436 [Entophlyctis helioformis]